MGSILFALVVTVLVVVAALAMVVKNLIFVAAPNEALIFSGRTRVLGNKPVGYRVIRGGRGLRTPLLERVNRVDLTMFTVEVTVNGAFSKGGIPLNVVGVANVKISSAEELLDNAVERFLNRRDNEIWAIAKETLEGNLRGVLAQLTPEQVNEDKTRFAQSLLEEAEHDMNRMGLTLETLKIQNVSDDVGYLSSIGRIRGADVRRTAAIAEADAHADAAVQRAENAMRSEIARIDADYEITRENFKKRIADALSKRTALIAESQGQVASSIAQTTAEIERQRARVLQVKRLLDAEVVQPAEADRRAAEEKARGDAAHIVEGGRAQAEALRALVEECRRAGPEAQRVLALQKLLPHVRRIAGSEHLLAVRKLTVLPKEGEGDLARRAISTNEQLKSAIGVDLADVVKRLAPKSQ